MKISRCITSLLIGMLTSVMMLSGAFHMDVRELIGDVIGQAYPADQIALAGFTSTEKDSPLVIATEIDSIKVPSQVTIHRTLSDFVHLTGIVADWVAYEKVEELCRSLTSGGQVKNELSVYEGASAAEWLGALSMLTRLDDIKKIRKANISVSNEVLELTGVVSNPDVRSDLTKVLESSFREGSPSFTLRLEVESIVPEFDLWMAADGTVLVQGVLDEGGKEQVDAILNEHLNQGRRLVNSVRVDPDVCEPDWYSAMISMLPDFIVNIKGGRLKCLGREITIKAVSSNAAVGEAVASFVGRAFPTSQFNVVCEIEPGEQGLVHEKEGLRLGLELPPTEATFYEETEAAIIYFGSGRAYLGRNDERKLDRLAKALRGLPEVRLELRGHSDSSGDPGLNHALSKERCQRVFDYLVKNGGIASDRLEINVVGSNGKIGRSEKDRRVDFVAYGNSGVIARKESEVPVSLTASTGETLPGIEGVVSATRVYFGVGQASVGDSGRAKLRGLAEALKQSASAPRLTILGMADPTGDPIMNLTLSRKRCESVYAFLKTHGVDVSQISIEEKGATDANLDDPEALQQSRRVEFKLLPDVETAI